MRITTKVQLSLMTRRTFSGPNQAASPEPFGFSSELTQQRDLKGGDSNVPDAGGKISRWSSISEFSLRTILSISVTPLRNPDVTINGCLRGSPKLGQKDLLELSVG